MRARIRPRKVRLWLIFTAAIGIIGFIQLRSRVKSGGLLNRPHNPDETRLILNGKLGTVGILHQDPSVPFAVSQNDPKIIARHPIEILIENAEKTQRAVQAKLNSVITLEDAVRDYQDTWGMVPPRGFDKWFELARSTGAIHVPSLIPESHTPFRNFLSVPPRLIQARVKKESPDLSYLLLIISGGDRRLNVTEPNDPNRADFWAGPQVRDLLNPIADLIPPPLEGDPDTVFLFTAEPYQKRVAAWEVYDKAQQMTSEGLMFDEHDLLELERVNQHRPGFQGSCPPDSPFRRETVHNVNTKTDMKAAYPIRGDWNYEQPKTFISDVRKAADFCENSDLTRMHSSFLVDRWRRTEHLVPTICQGGVYTATDNTWAPPMSAYITVPEKPWSEKTDGRLIWRGMATGMIHAPSVPWRAQQRHRLNYLAHNETGSRRVYVPQGDGRYRLEKHDVKQLVEHYTDMGLVGGPLFCREYDGSCEELRTEVAWSERIDHDKGKDYKYIFDIDGHGWSQRFRKELTAGSVVLKSTIYTAWHTSTLIPWYHYVPAKVDYSDLFDIMAFFQGSPDSRIPGRDDLAEKIAKQGREYAIDNWRREDMRSFTLLMVLEYHRMWASDREAASFKLPDQQEGT